MKKAFQILLFLVLFQLSTINFQLSTVHASELSLSISPPVIEVRGERLDQIERTIKVANEGQNSVDLEIMFIPMNSDGKFLNINLPIKSWITIKDGEKFIDKLTLRPKEVRSLNLNIFIPGVADIADYYFIIAFVSKSKFIGEGISENELRAYSSVNAGIATNILLSVGENKNSTAQIRIAELSSPIFVQSGPVEFRVKLVNEGRHFAKINGALLVTNMFGQKVAEIPLPDYYILSQASRTTTVLFTENFILGPYHAKLEIYNSKTDKENLFFALPTKAILIILSFILFLTILKRRLEKRFRT